MVIEDAVGGADHGFAVAFRIPRQAKAGLDVVGIGLDSLLQSQEVVSCQRKCIRRLELRCKLDVVTDAVV
jgi:hypothetical protein